MSGRRWLVPEVIQTSAMDCGPAALRCLLEGHGIQASLGRLREACQTNVDGTSIDTVEAVARQLGLDAEQVVVPLDHVLLDESAILPALAVIVLPAGLLHFVVVWARHGDWVQVMDPAGGRRWMRQRDVLAQLLVHEMPVDAAGFREWAGTADFLVPFARRLDELGAGQAHRRKIIDEALADPGWRTIARLDAAVRLVGELVQARAMPRGAPARALVAALVDGSVPLPKRYFSARETTPGDDGTERVTLRGAVLVKVRGRQPADATAEPLSRELEAALREPPPQPLRDLWRMLRTEGRLPIFAIFGAVVMAAVLAASNALAWQGMLHLVTDLGDGTSRLQALAALIAFLLVATLAELALLAGAKWIGRHLEIRIRAAFLEKIPRLGDRYFQSRLLSDMAERSHTTHWIGRLPVDAVQGLRDTAQLLAITVGLLWIDPTVWLPVIASSLISFLVPIAFTSLMQERTTRLRVQGGALIRYYVDAMLGLGPLRAHRGEQALRLSQEELTLEWARATRRVKGIGMTREAVQLVVAFAAAAWIVLSHLSRVGIDGSVLLLAFWALQLPILGASMAGYLGQLIYSRTTAARLLEPLGAPVEPEGHAEPSGGTGGVALRFEGVSVVAAGHAILAEVDLDVAPGSHVAIVGASGAGKSSLVALLLGWHRPATGVVRVDGAPLEGPDALAGLRRETVWLEPGVQLWNKSVLDNVGYGADTPTDGRIGHVLDAADLRPVLARLPHGLQTRLGDNGALVSGGEGQRVRLARALYRPGVRLAILDEPFRGLDRDRRKRHLAQAREAWRQATLLCVTHDLDDTRGFDRVLVVDDGRIVEDGAPAELAARPGSRYAAMLAAEEEVLRGRWQGERWRRLRVEGGRIVGDVS